MNQHLKKIASIATMASAALLAACTHAPKTAHDNLSVNEARIYIIRDANGNAAPVGVSVNGQNKGQLTAGHHYAVTVPALEQYRVSVQAQNQHEVRIRTASAQPYYLRAAVSEGADGTQVHLQNLNTAEGLAALAKTQAAP